MATKPEDIKIREVLFEFYRDGNVVRVSAIDADTNTEIVMVGAARYTEDMLKRMAIRKLKYVMAKQTGWTAD